MTTMMVIAFMGIFLLVLGTITSFAFEEAKYGRALYDREQALASAEAGLEYYEWFLAHFPGNLTNGTGKPGPYTYTVNDPETGASMGTAAISVVGNSQCGQIQSIDITSVGRSNLNPGFPRTLTARYMQKSSASYSYILNSSVWAGPDRNITGKYFSNGGIRMDGTNNSTVASAQTTWDCTNDYNCYPEQPNAPGVVGSGSGSALWINSAASIAFSNMTVSLANLKTYAQNNGGLYFASLGNTNNSGYHIIFKSDGTFDVYKVTSTISTPAYSSDVGWFTEYGIINAQTFLGNYTIPSSCSLIFVEDRAWVEGVVHGKVTLVAATPSNPSLAPDIFIPNNITYTTSSGTDGLTVIAASDVLIPLNSPDTMQIHGIYAAIGGHFGRNFYTSDSGSYGSSYVVPSAYSSYVMRTQLTTEGSVISNTRTGTAWSDGVSTISGYLSRIDAYDQLQATNPPPFTPVATTDYGFALWREL